MVVNDACELGSFFVSQLAKRDTYQVVNDMLDILNAIEKIQDRIAMRVEKDFACELFNYTSDERFLKAKDHDELIKIVLEEMEAKKGR